MSPPLHQVVCITDNTDYLKLQLFCQMWQEFEYQMDICKLMKGFTWNFINKDW